MFRRGFLLFRTEKQKALKTQGFQGFLGGDKRDRTADLLDAILYNLERTGKERTLHLTRIPDDDSDDTPTPGANTVTIVTE